MPICPVLSALVDAKGASRAVCLRTPVGSTNCKTLSVPRVESIAQDKIRTRKPQGGDSWATISIRGCGHTPQARRGPGQHSSACQVREARAQRPMSESDTQGQRGSHRPHVDKQLPLPTTQGLQRERQGWGRGGIGKEGASWKTDLYQQSHHSLVMLIIPRLAPQGDSEQVGVRMSDYFASVW